MSAVTLKRLVRSTYPVLRAVTPPIVVAGARWARDQARPRPAASEAADYSTLDNPLEVPCQVECYLHCREKYIRPTDAVLDVGSGLGYGLHIMAAKADRLEGIDIDRSAVARAARIFAGHPRVSQVQHYEGDRLPFADKSFDVVSCVEVVEHVPDYDRLLRDLCRVARRVVFLTTPNRRPEYTRRNGRPLNHWHLREWTMPELDAILLRLGCEVEWNVLNGPWDGPYQWSNVATDDTTSLAPAIILSE